MSDHQDPTKPAQKEHNKRKRKSLADEETHTIHRPAEEDVAQEVDTMILDYQVHHTIESILKPTTTDSSMDAEVIQSNATMLWSWLHRYNQQYTAHIHDPDVHLRLRLAQFLMLYCQRMQPGDHIPNSRERQEAAQLAFGRCAAWIDIQERVPSLTFDIRNVFDDQLPLATSILERFRLGNPSALKRTDLTNFYGTPESISILDVLPQFMYICAAFYAKSQMQPTVITFRLMIDLIRQAYLEQFLVYGEKGCDTIDSAFSWGCLETTRSQEVSPQDRQIDRMFRDSQTGEEHAQWQQMRRAALGELMLGIGNAESLQTRLTRLAELHPLQEFDERLREFVTELTNALDPPILAQLEAGCLIGMSADETAAFLHSCGIEQQDWNACEEWDPWLYRAERRDSDTPP